MATRRDVCDEYRRICIELAEAGLLRSSDLVRRLAFYRSTPQAWGWDATGNLTGLGWRSVFSVATGVQYQWTEALSLRLGYVYTDNPIPAEFAAINIAAPAIYQHILSMGATLRVTCRTSFSLAYLHAFAFSS